MQGLVLSWVVNKLLLILFLIFLFVELKAQTNKSPCQDPINYAPLISEHVPLLRVQLAFHVLLKDNGTGNFSPDSQNHKDYIIRIFNFVNNTYSHLSQNQFETTSPYISDSRIQFVLDTIYYHFSTENWDLFQGNNLSKRSAKMKTVFSTFVEKNNIHKKNTTLHIFFGEGDNTQQDLVQGLASGVGTGKWAVIVGSFNFFLENNHWLPAQTLGHEIAHCLGLFHCKNGATPNNDYCNDTPTYPQNPTCWNGAECSNNMMDRNAQQSALTACQIGRMHYHLQGQGGDVSRFVISDWCDFHASETVTISKSDNVVWNATKKLHGNIIIQSNATLTIKCLLHLPHKGKIIVRPSGKLIIDGGEITNVCNQMWNGIYIKQEKKKKHTKSGTVEMLNGGKISNCEHKIIYE